jgi:hypothetical protein
MYGQMQFDAQAALGFVVSQATHIEATVNETIYPDIQYPGLIPVDTSAHPFTQTVTYYSSDKFGTARWINGNADDIPLAGSERTQHKTSVYTAGIGYGFGWEEVNVAMLMGVNLPAEDALAARRAYEEMVDVVALRGDASKGFAGLLNYPGVTAIAAQSAAVWTDPATTEDDMLDDVNELLQGVETATGYTSTADTLLLPNQRLRYLASTRLGDTGETVLQFLRRNNILTAMTGRPLTIRTIRGLETAGAGGTQRMIAYRRDPQVLKLHIPMPHRFLGIFQDGPLHWVNPGVFRLGGLDIRLPAEVRYSDGI